MNKNMTRIAELLDLAYANLLSDNFDHDFVVGCVAEAKAIAEGDKGSFDNQHESDDTYDAYGVNTKNSFNTTKGESKC